MTQFYRNTSIPLVAGVPYFVNIATGKSRGKRHGNVTLANTASGAIGTLTITYLSQQGVVVDTCPPGQTLYAPGLLIDDIIILTTANGTIALDVRWPESLPPQSLTVSGGSITATSVITGSSRSVPGSVTLPTAAAATYAFSYVVPAGQVLTLFGLELNWHNTDGVNTGTVTLAQVTYLLGAAGQFQILKDTTGGAIATGKQYDAVAYNKTSPANLPAGTAGVAVAYAEQCGFPIQLYPGDSVQVTFTFTGASTVGLLTLILDSVLEPE